MQTEGVVVSDRDGPSVPTRAGSTPYGPLGASIPVALARRRDPFGTPAPTRIHSVGTCWR